MVTTAQDKRKMKEKQCFDKVLLGSEVVTRAPDRRENRGKTML